eukprot:9488946-Pyramimonas_sp.AAC.1
MGSVRGERAAVWGDHHVRPSRFHISPVLFCKVHLSFTDTGSLVSIGLVGLAATISHSLPCFARYHPSCFAMSNPSLFHTGSFQMISTAQIWTGTQSGKQPTPESWDKSKYT